MRQRSAINLSFYLVAMAFSPQIGCRPTPRLRDRDPGELVEENAIGILEAGVCGVEIVVLRVLVSQPTFYLLSATLASQHCHIRHNRDRS